MTTSDNIDAPTSSVNSPPPSKKVAPSSSKRLSFARFVRQAWVPSEEARLRTKGLFLPFRHGATAHAVGWVPIEVADTLAFLKHYSWLPPGTDKYGFGWLVEQIKSLIHDDRIKGTVMMGMLRVPVIFDRWRTATAERALH